MVALANFCFEVLLLHRTFTNSEIQSLIHKMFQDQFIQLKTLLSSSIAQVIVKRKKLSRHFHVAENCWALKSARLG